MILLIGGTGETAALAEGLAAAGYEVLVSTATDVPLAVGNHPRISRREGRLGEEGIAALAEEKGIRAIDAAHPYAAAVHDSAYRAAHRLNIPYLLFRRPEADIGGEDLHFAADHAEAAEMAFSFGSPVLLTTGSRNLAPYAQAARRTGLPYAARVLDTRESREACRAAGIPEDRIIAGRGPFSLEENLAAILRFEIGVIVTKEGGRIAASTPNSPQRGKPTARSSSSAGPRPDLGPVFDDPAALIAALKAIRAR